MVWVCSVPFQSCITSFGDCTLLPHQETTEKESLLAVYMWRWGVPFLSVALMEIGGGGRGDPLRGPYCTLPLDHIHGMMHNVLSLDVTIFLE